MRLRPLKPLECEKTLLSIYKGAAEVHPPAVRAFLHEQVTNVCAKWVLLLFHFSLGETIWPDDFCVFF